MTHSVPVGHEPAGDSDGNGDEGEERGDDERDDKADLGHAHLRVGRRRRALSCDLGVRFPALQSQDGVGLNLETIQLFCYNR